MRAVKNLALAAVLLMAACARTAPTASSSPTPASSPSATATAPGIALPTPTASPSPSPSPQPSLPTAPPPSVSCTPGVIPTSQALLGTFLYDVGDPLHPRAVCKILNTWPTIVTGTTFEYLVPRADGTTDVVLHALGSNNESTVATVKADLFHAYESWYGGVAWNATSASLAYLAAGGADANGLSVTDVWLATASARTKLYSYSVPGKDAFGRPGFAPETLAFSPDGAYLAAGWSVATSLPRVFRVSDGANVGPTLPSDFRFAFWARTGDTLYLVGDTEVSTWSPGGAVTKISSTSWILEPNFSPDGKQIAFTVVTSTHQVRPYVFDTSAGTNRLLTDQPRSSVVFVKDGWVWEDEEKTCVPATDRPCFDPTEPDGKVLAMELATGRESTVTFAAGESTYGAQLGLWPAA